MTHPTPPEPANRRSGPCCEAAATLAGLLTDGRWIVERTETTWTSKRLPDDPDDLGVNFTCPCGAARRASRKPETCVCGRPYGLYSAQTVTADPSGTTPSEDLAADRTAAMRLVHASFQFVADELEALGGPNDYLRREYLVAWLRNPATAAAKALHDLMGELTTAGRPTPTGEGDR